MLGKAHWAEELVFAGSPDPVAASAAMVKASLVRSLYATACWVGDVDWLKSACGQGDQPATPASYLAQWQQAGVVPSAEVRAVRSPVRAGAQAALAALRLRQGPGDGEAPDWAADVAGRLFAAISPTPTWLARLTREPVESAEAGAVAAALGAVAAALAAAPANLAARLAGALVAMRHVRPDAPTAWLGELIGGFLAVRSPEEAQDDAPPRQGRLVLQSESIGVLWHLPEPNTGLLVRLTGELMAEGSGQLYPDPWRHLLFLCTDEFGAALTQAARAASAALPPGAHDPATVDVRWRLEPAAGESLPPLIDGPSMGAAMALVLRHLLDPALPRLDPGWAITGAIEPDGRIGAVTHYETKLAGIEKVTPSQPRRALLPTISLADSGSLKPLVAELEHAGWEIRGVATLDQASDFASGWADALADYLGHLRRWLGTPSPLLGNLPAEMVQPLMQPVRLDRPERADAARGLWPDLDEAVPTGTPWSVLRSRTRRAAILGDAGWGKSTLLRREALTLAEEATRRLEPGAGATHWPSPPEAVPLPLYCPAHRFRAALTEAGGDAVAAVAAIAAEVFPPDVLPRTGDAGAEQAGGAGDGGGGPAAGMGKAARFRGWVRVQFGERRGTGEHCVLLLDGLDELPPGEQTAVFHALDALARTRCRIVLAARAAGFERPGWLVEAGADGCWHLLPWTRDEVAAFIAAWSRARGAPREGDALLDALRQAPALEAIARTPFGLTVLCEVFSGLDDASRRALRAGEHGPLLEAVVQAVASGRWHPAGAPAHVPEDEAEARLNAAENIAWRLADGPNHTWRHQVDWRQPGIAPKTIRLAVASGLLVAASTAARATGARGPYQFMHRRLHTYLVARGLARASPATVIRRVKAARFAPDWREACRYLGSCLVDPAPAVRALLALSDDPGHTALWLAVEIAGEAGGERLAADVREAVARRAERVAWSVSSLDRGRAYQALRLVGGGEAAAALGRLARGHAADGSIELALVDVDTLGQLAGRGQAPARATLRWLADPLTDRRLQRRRREWLRLAAEVAELGWPRPAAAPAEAPAEPANPMPMGAQEEYPPAPAHPVAAALDPVAEARDWHAGLLACGRLAADTLADDPPLTSDAAADVVLDAARCTRIPLGRRQRILAAVGRRRGQRAVSLLGRFLVEHDRAEPELARLALRGLAEQPWPLIGAVERAAVASAIAARLPATEAAPFDPQLLYQAVRALDMIAAVDADAVSATAGRQAVLSLALAESPGVGWPDGTVAHLVAALGRCGGTPLDRVLARLGSPDSPGVDRAAAERWLAEAVRGLASTREREPRSAVIQAVCQLLVGWPEPPDRHGQLAAGAADVPAACASTLATLLGQADTGSLAANAEAVLAAAEARREPQRLLVRVRLYETLISQLPRLEQCRALTPDMVRRLAALTVAMLPSPGADPVH